MLLSLLPFLNPVLGRLASPKVSVPIELLAMVALLVRARVKREPVRPYVVGVALSVGALGLLLALMLGMPALPERLWQHLYGAQR